MKIWFEVPQRPNKSIIRFNPLAGHVQGIEYISHARPWSVSCRSGCTRVAIKAFTAQPKSTIRVVRRGWQSRTTELKISKDIISRIDQRKIPRRPNPAARPPKMFRTSHSRSKLLSSNISRRRPSTSLGSL